MSEDIERRKVSSRCDLCDREDEEVTVLVARTGKVWLLCSGCEERLKKLFNQIGVKWSETWF